jgi:hypothetical protein
VVLCVLYGSGATQCHLARLLVVVLARVASLRSQCGCADIRLTGTRARAGGRSCACACLVRWPTGPTLLLKYLIVGQPPAPGLCSPRIGSSAKHLA